MPREGWCWAGAVLWGRQAAVSQSPVDAVLVFLPRRASLLGTIQPKPADAQRTERGHHRGAQANQRDPVWRLPAPVLQQFQLPSAGVFQHPHVPAVVAGFEKSLGMFQQRRVELGQGPPQTLSWAGQRLAELNAVG